MNNQIENYWLMLASIFTHAFQVCAMNNQSENVWLLQA